MIISLYAGGMTLRDISHHLVSTIGTELSHETISKITDQVAEEVLVWQRAFLVWNGSTALRRCTAYCPALRSVVQSQREGNDRIGPERDDELGSC
jgi:Transposase, Mutator family